MALCVCATAVMHGFRRYFVACGETYYEKRGEERRGEESTGGEESFSGDNAPIGEASTASACTITGSCSEESTGGEPGATRTATAPAGCLFFLSPCFLRLFFLGFCLLNSA